MKFAPESMFTLLVVIQCTYNRMNDSTQRDAVSPASEYSTVGGSKLPLSTKRAAFPHELGTAIVYGSQRRWPTQNPCRRVVAPGKVLVRMEKKELEREA